MAIIVIQQTATRDGLSMSSCSHPLRNSLRNCTKCKKSPVRSGVSSWPDLREIPLRLFSEKCHPTAMHPAGRSVGTGCARNTCRRATQCTQKQAKKNPNVGSPEFKKSSPPNSTPVIKMTTRAMISHIHILMKCWVRSVKIWAAWSGMFVSRRERGLVSLLIFSRNSCLSLCSVKIGILKDCSRRRISVLLNRTCFRITLPTIMKSLNRTMGSRNSKRTTPRVKTKK